MMILTILIHLICLLWASAYVTSGGQDDDNRYVKKSANPLTTLVDTVQMLSSLMKKKMGSYGGVYKEVEHNLSAAMFNRDFMKQKD